MTGPTTTLNDPNRTTNTYHECAAHWKSETPPSGQDLRRSLARDADVGVIRVTHAVPEDQLEDPGEDQYQPQRPHFFESPAENQRSTSVEPALRPLPGGTGRESFSEKSATSFAVTSTRVRVARLLLRKRCEHASLGRACLNILLSVLARWLLLRDPSLPSLCVHHCESFPDSRTAV